MTSSELREILERDAFQPFLVQLTSGDTYEVHNPQLAVVMRSRLFLAFPKSDRWTLIPFLHIAAIELLDNGARLKPRRKKRD